MQESYPTSIYDQNGKTRYPDTKTAKKTISFGAAYTCIDHIRESPHPGVMLHHQLLFTQRHPLEFLLDVKFFITQFLQLTM